MVRIANFQKILKQNRLDGFIVTNTINIFYLCGFRGASLTEREGTLIFAPSKKISSHIFNPKPILITARLYQSEAHKLESKNLNVIIVNERNKILEEAKKLFLHPRGERRSNSAHPEGVKVGFEEQDLKYAEYQEFKKALPNRKLTPTKNLVENLRLVKTKEELANIEKAQIISQKAFDQIIKTIKVGQTEEEVAEKLASIIKQIGGHGLAFESIIASGPNAALPHHTTGKRKIKSGEVLLFDFGAKYNNYYADLSRTIFVGQAKNEHKKVYAHVQKAQKQAIEKIAHGLPVGDLYHTANDVFKAVNMHEYFIHGLGHGIGLEIHEPPYLRPIPSQARLDIDRQARNNTHYVLREGMVFSIEPGLYFPEWGGIRIEDLVTIQNGKVKVLGKLAENLIEL